MDSSVLYAEINAIGVIIMVFLALKMNDISMTTSHIYLKRMFIAEAVFFLADFVCILVDGSSAPAWVNYAANFVFFAMSVVCPYIWSLYVSHDLGYIRPTRENALWMVPAAAVILLVLSSPVTGIFFTITPDNLYQRGPLYITQPVVSFLYLFKSTYIAVQGYRKSTSFVVKSRAKIFASFIVFPLGAAVADILTDGIPFLCPVTTLSLLFVFVSVQQQLVTRDQMTGLGNRYELRSFVDELGASDGAIIVVNIDFLKKINDEFGYAAGDRAIIITAGCVKRVCDRNKLFCARIGGDEFIIILEGKDILDSEEIKEEILSEIREEGKDLVFCLSVSAGTAMFSKDNGITRDLIEVAKGNMYLQKSLNT